MTTCKSCEAPISWAITPDGRRLPIDATPSTAGNIRLELTGQDCIAHVLGAAEAQLRRNAGQTLYVSHFSTCPNADEHRKVPAVPDTPPML